jgi:hypothetical protein
MPRHKTSSEGATYFSPGRKSGVKIQQELRRRCPALTFHSCHPERKMSIRLRIVIPSRGICSLSVARICPERSRRSPRPRERYGAGRVT